MISERFSQFSASPGSLNMTTPTDVKSSLLSWVKERSDHVYEGINVFERFNQIENGEYFSNELGALLCSMRIVDAGGVVHGLRTWTDHVYEVEYIIVDANQPRRDEYAEIIIDDYVARRDATEGAQWIKADYGTKYAALYDAAEDISVDQEVYYTGLTSLIQSADEQGKIATASAMTYLDDKASSLNALLETAVDASGAYSIWGLAAALRTNLESIADSTDGETQEDIGYVFSIDDYTSPNTMNLLSSIWSGITGIASIAASILLIIGKGLFATFGAVAYVAGAAFKSAYQLVLDKTSLAYGSGIYATYAKGISCTFPLSRLGWATTGSGFAEAGQAHIALPWGHIMVERVLNDSQNCRLLIFPIPMNVSSDIVGVDGNMPSPVYIPYVDSEASNIIIRYATGLQASDDEDASRKFNMAASLAERFPNACFPYFKPSSDITLLEQHLSVLTGSLIYSLSCIFWWLAMHMVAVRVPNLLRFTASDITRWRGKWPTSSDVFYSLFNAGLNGTFPNQLTDSWMHNDSRDLAAIDSWIDTASTGSDCPMIRLLWTMCLCLLGQDNEPDPQYTISQAWTSLGSVIRLDFQLIKDGKPSSYGYASWGEYLNNNGRRNMVDLYATGDDAPFVPTDPWICPPNVDRRGLIAGLFLGFALTAATAVSVVAVRNKIRNHFREKCLRREREAILAQDEFKESPTKENAAKARKAQKRFARIARRTGYSSNNVGTFNVGSSAGISEIASSLDKAPADQVVNEPDLALIVSLLKSGMLE